MGEWISSLCLWSRRAWNIYVTKVKSEEYGERWLEIRKRSDNHSAQAKLQVSSWDARLEICVCAVLVTQSCPTLCNPMDWSPPGSSVHGIFLGRILEWVAISSSRGSSWPRDPTCVSGVSCIDRQILYHCVTWQVEFLAFWCQEVTQCILLLAQLEDWWS